MNQEYKLPKIPTEKDKLVIEHTLNFTDTEKLYWEDMVKRMQISTYGTASTGQGSAQALINAIQEYDQSIHGPVGIDISARKRH